MDQVWESQLFASLSELLAAVNDRRLTADRFKIVPEPSHADRGMFHLVYLTGAEPDPMIQAVAVGAGMEAGTADLDQAEERIEAVDEAEAIIRDNQHD